MDAKESRLVTIKKIENPLSEKTLKAVTEEHYPCVSISSDLKFSKSKKIWLNGQTRHVALLKKNGYKSRNIVIILPP